MKMFNAKRFQRLSQSISPCVEALEARQLCTATPWNWNAQLIHQDQAAIDFPAVTGSGEAVVVIDTGADSAHPAFAGRNIIWKDFFGTSATPIDTYGHGTGVAGVLAGNGFTFTDGTYGQGIAPGTQLIVLRADSGTTTSWAPQAQRISAALDWVIANQATYNIVGVNISLGSNQRFTDTALTGDKNLALDQTLQAKFATLNSHGVFIGSAAGNDGAKAPNTVDYPAADPSVYSTGSVNSSGAVSASSSRGVLNDLYAPGENIIGPYDFPTNPSLATTYYINYLSGTSFSSPQVVGAAALIKQIDPAFTPQQILQILKDSGTPVADPVTGNTFALLNLDAALKLAVVRADAVDNHSPATALPLSFVGNTAQFSGLTSLVGTPDYYSFTLTNAAAVNFQISATGGAAPTGSLLDSNGNVLTASAGQNVTLTAGTYYLLATGGSTTLAGTYSVAIQRTESTSSNHDASHATPISLATGQGQISGAVLLADLPDYYSFTLDKIYNITASLKLGAGQTATGSILTLGGATIANIPATGAAVQLTAGTYFILVTSPTSLSGTYGLSVAASAVVITPTPTPTPNPSPTNSAFTGAGAADAKVAYDPYGRLHVAYYDGVAKNLKYAMRNVDGSWNNVVTIDASPAAGTQLSLAIDPYGQPGIAYYDAGTRHLKYAHFNGSAWSVSVVDAVGVTGWNPSLVYTNTATPYIAYFMASKLDLRVASLNGSRWNIATVDSKGNVGFVPSIAYDKATGQIGVAYQDLTHSWYKYATPSGRGWKLSIIDTTTHAAGGSLSLAFDASHLPAVAYNDAYTLDLRYAHSNGVSWSVQQVNGNAHGMAANLSFDSTGAADILYNNLFAGDIERANNHAGVWSNTPITGGGSFLNSTRGAQGQQTISWITSDGVQLDDL
jgi:hypothetical protein